MKRAGVDIGTNSVRLLIRDDHGAELERHMQITRLGQGVDRSGELHPEAIARTTAVLAQYGELLRRHGVERVRAAATSAARDARNGADFLAAAERALGVQPQLIDGEEEARLSFRGATKGLPLADGPFLVIDIGGGSTELVLGSTGPESLISIDVGCVRMTERHLQSDPARETELAACAEDVRTALGAVRRAIDVTRARRVIGLAGTITAIAALELGLQQYDAARTHHARLTRTQVERAFARLCAADVHARRTMLAEPKRAEVIVGGACVLHTLMVELAIDELTVSETDILDGLCESA
ncbi:MAG TPA: Ppx/GppA family phosphatase [Polyangiales bacterium]|nr:Ppx/GppA family phosphatase [Polyangiales bacterium]